MWKLIDAATLGARGPRRVWFWLLLVLLVSLVLRMHCDESDRSRVKPRDIIPSIVCPDPNNCTPPSAPPDSGL